MEGRQDYSQLAEVVLHRLGPGHSFVYFIFLGQVWFAGLKITKNFNKNMNG
jgi:hypothetical protein